jgi:hypothetical protein
LQQPQFGRAKLAHAVIFAAPDRFVERAKTVARPPSPGD